MVAKGPVLLGIAESGQVMYFVVWYGYPLRGPVLLGWDLWRRLRQGVSWRGLASHGTALSCPVRMSKVLSAKAFRGEALYGFWRGVLSCWVKWCFVGFGMEFRGGVQVLLGQVRFGSASCGKVLSWLGEVLIGAVGSVEYSTVV